MTKTRSALLLGPAILSMIACASDLPTGDKRSSDGSPENVGSVAAPVVNGDATTAYPMVGRYTVTKFPSGATRGCSGVLIAPLLVLTARHCAAGSHEESGFDFDGCKDEDAECSELQSFPFDLNPVAVCTASDSLLCVGHTATLSGPMVSMGGGPDDAPVAGCSGRPISTCANNGRSRDLAVFKLDRRAAGVPLAPVAGLGGAPGCADKFLGNLVGYGGGAFTRNTAASNGWTYEPHDGAGMYFNGWDSFEHFRGSESGDSGGGLFDSITGQLCGIVSAHATTTTSSTFPPQVNVVWRSYTAGVDSPAATAFLLANNAIDAYGNLLGACNSGPLSFRDVDSDCDGIPDACDPCVYLPDPSYRTTGKFSAPFAKADGTLLDDDGDGVANVCDNCAAAPNPMVPAPGPLGSPSFPAPPGVGCGQANLPVGQHLAQPDGDSDGLGDACDKCGSIRDAVCCNSDADCNPRAPKGLKCRPTIPNAPSYTPGVGGGAPPSHPCAGGSMCEASMDSDGDAIGDACDKCPRAFDFNQLDSDLDGIGDACDTCKDLSDTTPPPGVAVGKVSCSLPGPKSSIPASDLFCQLQSGKATSACVRLPDGSGACSHSRDADGDGVGDVCDNCKMVPNTDQANCNLHIESRVGGKPFPYVGDACDREPCAAVEIQDFSADVAHTGSSDNWVRLKVDPIMLPAGQPGAYSYPGAPLSTGPRASIGFRACKCDLGQVNGVDRPVSAALCEAKCPFDPTKFGGSLLWTSMNLVPSTELADPPTGAAPAFLPNSVLPNAPLFAPGLVANASAGLPGPSSYVQWDISDHPSAKAIGVLSDFSTPGFGFSGVMWTSAQALSGLGGAAASATFSEWGHHYNGGVLGLPQTFSAPSYSFERAVPCMNCGQCLACSYRETPYLMRRMEEPGWLGWGLERAQLIASPTSDMGLLSSFNDPASELISPSDGFSLRGNIVAALLNPADPSGAVGISLRDGTIARVGPRRVDDTSFRTAAWAALGPPVLTQQGTVLSSTERSLFLLGGRQASGGANDALWQLALDSGAWSTVPLTGTAPGKVLAAVFRSEDRSFYVIDELRWGPLTFARLIRVSLDNVKGTVIGTWPRLRKFDRTYLSVAEDGALILAATRGTGSSKGKSWIAKLDVTGDRVDLEWLRQETGQLSAIPVLSKRGLTAHFESGGGRFVSTSDLARIRRTGHTGDCF